MRPSQQALELNASLKALRLALGTSEEARARLAHQALVARLRAAETRGME